MSITKFNKGRIFDVNLEGKTKIKLSDLHDTVPTIINAILFTEKGNFGKSVFVVAGDCIIYLPKHKLKDCEAICEDAQLVQDIKDGKVAILPETYEDETGATRYSVKWCDV